MILGDVFARQITGEWGNECTDTGKGVKVLRTTNFTPTGNINYNNVVIRNIPKQKIKVKRLRYGDIILEKSGGTEKTPVGRVVFCGKEIENATYLCNNFTQAMRVNPEIAEAKYVFYYMWYLHSSGKTELLQNKTTGIRNLKVKSYLEYKIPLPAIEEQRRIAAVLDKVTDLIAKRQAQLDKLDELVKSRFVEMFGDPIVNSKSLSTAELGKICHLKAGTTTSAEEIHTKSTEFHIPCYGGNGIRGYVKTATQCGTYPIIGRQGALCGNVQFATGAFHATEHAILVTPIVKANKVWLYYLLKFMDLYRFHTGAAQPGLTVKTLNTVSVPICDIVYQDEFADYAQKVYSRSKKLQRSLENMNSLKRSLIQLYFCTEEKQ